VPDEVGVELPQPAKNAPTATAVAVKHELQVVFIMLTLSNMR
jgi:hypothetical protein